MAAKYILATLAAVFLVMGLLRASGTGGSRPQARAWLLIASTFGVVSAWLFYRG